MGHDHATQATARQRAAFDAIAHAYDALIPPHVMAHYVRKRLDLIQAVVPRGRVVLDVGCGTGRVVDALRQRQVDAVGVDGSLEMLKQRTSPGVPVAQGRFDALPFRTGSLGGIVTIATLHHTVDPELLDALLREMARVLAPGGHMILWDHNPNNPYWHILMPRLLQDRGGYRLVPRRELVGRLQRIGGLRVVRLERLGGIPEFIPERLMPMAQRFEAWWERAWGLKWLLAHNVVVVQKLE